MPEDNRVDPPEQPKTVSVPREDILQAQLKQLLTRVTEGFGKVDTLVVDVTRLTGTVELVSNDLGIVKDRVTILETERSKFSGGIRGLSKSDDGQNMQIASLAVKVDAMSEKADSSHVMLTTLTSIANKPLVRNIAYAAGALLLAALTAGTGYLARGNVAQPTPTIIQVAPAATQVPR